MTEECIVLEAKATGTPSTASDLARVQVMAYSGDAMSLPGLGLTVIDLAGMELPGRVVLLADHVNEVRNICGSGTPNWAEHPQYRSQRTDGDQRVSGTDVCRPVR